MRWPHQVHLLLRSFTGPLDARGPHLQQTGTWRLVETSKILSFNPVYWFYYCLCVFRRVAVCPFVMERSTSWVDEEKTLKPLTTSCATTRPPASSDARLLCLVPSPTMAALPYNVSAENNANPESICKCTCRLGRGRRTVGERMALHVNDDPAGTQEKLVAHTRGRPICVFQGRYRLLQIK